MKIIRVLLLMLILWSLPSIALFLVGPNLGSLLSYTTIGLLGVYYLFETKTKPNWWIIVLSFSYFVISGFQYYDSESFFILELIKFFIFIIGGYELVKRTSKEALLTLLILGSLSVAVDALLFPSKFGRYSGFYLNPNEAGFICMYGYALVYSIKNTSIKLLGQFVFTLMGLLTFSRTFIVIWLVVNIASLWISIKNIRVLGIGVLIFTTLIFIDESIGLNNPRFDQLKNIVSNKSISINEVNENSRMETWSKHYEHILESPFFGNGYGTFSGKLDYLGVHNSYLMIAGEAGIIPFMLLLGYVFYLIYGSIYFFKKSPYLILLTITLAMFLLTDHNLFTNYYILFSAMWIQYQILKIKNELFETDNQIELNKIE